MEIVPAAFTGNLRKNWRKRGYNNYNKVSPNKRTTKVIRFGTSSKRLWKLRLVRKFRLVRFTSPLKLWYKFKNAYMNMMLKITPGSGGNAFGTKRIPKARDVSMGYTRTEFENRLIFEIYKSMVASYELGYTK